MKIDKEKSNRAYILNWAKKIKAIELLGGECKVCGEKNIFCLSFHHVVSEEKENSINNLKEGRWSLLEKELEKCIILCANCHMETHHKENNKFKESLVEICDIKGCTRCNYIGKNLSSLSFHHKIREEKTKSIAHMYRKERRNFSIENIRLEISKCVVLCQNCHKLEHLDKQRFDKNKDAIYKKVLSYKENRRPADEKRIIELYTSGVKPCVIAKQLNCYDSTISRVIKNCMK